MAELPPGRRVITRSKSEQRVNLKELLGRVPSDAEKDLFTRRAVELINQRTLDGKDLEGKTFTPYSAAYADKKGVSRTSVDLFLEGDMLGSIKKINETKNTVSFGITDSEEAAKSENHNKGVSLPKREFFGITRSEAKKIADEVSTGEPQEEQPRRRTLAELRDALAAISLGRDDDEA